MPRSPASRSDWTQDFLLKHQARLIVAFGVYKRPEFEEEFTNWAQQ